jgi:O-antigen/teichoic acid export membrane protein
VMLSLMKGDEVVGWYNAAYRLVFSLGIIPSVYFSAAFPVMSKFFITSHESLRLINEKSIKYMCIVALPMAVGTSLLASKVVPLVFGAGYQNSVIALQLLVWAVAFVFISSAFARLFESLNRQMIVSIVAGSCAFINVALNLILIPNFSYKGSCIATVATEFGALAILVVWSSKIGYGVSWSKIMNFLARTLGASVVMGVFVFYLQNLVLWVLIPVSALLYFVVLFIIKGIDSEDQVLLKQMMHKSPVAKPEAFNADKI